MEEQQIKTTEQIELLYRSYLKWMVAPKQPNDPKTLLEFCKVNELTKQHIESFVNRDTYHSDILTTTLMWAKSKVPELFHKAYSEATEDRGNLNAAGKFVDMLVELEKSQKAPDKSNEGKINNTFIINHINNDKFRELTTRIARKTGLLDGSSETRSPDVLPGN